MASYPASATRGPFGSMRMPISRAKAYVALGLASPRVAGFFVPRAGARDHAHTATGLKRSARPYCEHKGKREKNRIEEE